MEKRDSFIFYRSFMEALEELSDEQYARVFRAISKFALDGKETKLTGVEKAIFQLTKPQLLANQKRWENGCRGGRKPTETKPNNNQDETETKPNENQNESNRKPNENVNVNENENVLKVSKKESKEDIFKNNTTHVRESYDEIISVFDFSLPVENKIRSFIQYCHLNRQILTNDQLNGILVELDLRYEDDYLRIRALDDAMRGGYFALRRANA